METTYTCIWTFLGVSELGATKRFMRESVATATTCFVCAKAKRQQQRVLSVRKRSDNNNNNTQRSDPTSLCPKTPGGRNFAVAQLICNGALPT